MNTLFAYLRRFREKKIYVPGIGGVLLLAVIIAYAVPDTLSVASTAAKRSDFSVSISVSGEIRAANMPGGGAEFSFRLAVV